MLQRTVSGLVIVPQKDDHNFTQEEYEALTDAGKKATPVWKQVLSSLFSWQTAMAALITLSVVYGKEIGGWVKSLFGVKDAASLDTYLETVFHRADARPWLPWPVHFVPCLPSVCRL